MERRPFTPGEKRSLWGCILAYCSAYVGRHNIAMLLTALREEFTLTSAQVGVVVSLFAVTYAVGQLVNGSIVDRLNPRRHILLGLAGSVLCNLMLWLSSSYAMVLIAWGLNGVAQSMLWSPVVKIAAGSFAEEKRSRVSFLLSLSMPVANMAAWAIAGQASAWGQWRLGALIPALVMGLAIVVCGGLLKDAQVASSGRAQRPKDSSVKVTSLLLPYGLGLLLLSCVSMGFVRDGIMNWGPTILSDITSYSAAEASSISLLVPFLSILGIGLGRGAFAIMKKNPYNTLSLMATVAAGFAILLALFGYAHAFLFAMLLSLLCALLQGANPMISSLIPMQYETLGRVGTVAGTVDCAFYLGASLSGVVTGALSMSLGWATVINSWWVGCLLVAITALISGKTFSARTKMDVSA